MEVTTAAAGSVPAGYKQTEVGLIPEDWDVQALESFVSLRRGHDLSAEQRRPGHVPIMSGAGQSGFHDVFVAKGPGVVLGRSGASFGQAYFCQHDFWPHNTALYVTDFKSNHPLFVFYALGNVDFSRHNSGGAQQSLNRNFIARIPIRVPRPSEQQAIGTALGDLDALLGGLDRLIAKKRDLKQAAMQQLLTGRTRLPASVGKWKTKTIAQIAVPKSDRNSLAKPLPVLTCSKHLGFLDSLEFFRNQVFSRNLTGYKIIQRGEIGYPSNHVEEGSIGLQDLYDVAVVSPIYVVFCVNQETDSYFLHRLLKLDSYRQKFKIATSSSVARRGSLRWRAFSEIVVKMPPLAEQRAVAAVLKEMEAELEALEQRRAKTLALKQGMMQELLTGGTRLV